MVATTQSPPPPLTIARRSFTATIEQPADRHHVAASRRHSFAVSTVTQASGTALIELKSPRSLKEYEAELLAASYSQPSSRWTRFDERSPRDFGGSLPRKLTLSRRQPTCLRRRSAKRDDEPAIRLEIVGPALAQMETIVADVLQGFQAHVGPVAVDDGTGGVYYLRTKAQRIVAVFKPSDEEPHALNNPKGHLPNTAPPGDVTSKDRLASGIRGGIAPGHAAIREVAAYLLDHDRRAGVPPTVFVAARHPAFFTRGVQRCPSKLGSLQLYIPHDCTADDISESLLPVDQVQAMAMLDIRLANQDRHGGNVLILTSSTGTTTLRKGYDLVPIDHGACLPRVSCLDETSFLWQHWPQAKKPFSLEATAYIASLDAVGDAQQLARQLPRAYQLENEALLTLVVCTVLLQVCAVDFGMTAHEIAALMCRQEPTESSVLEQLVELTMNEEVCSHEDVTTSLWKEYATGTVTRFQLHLRQYLTKGATGR